MINVGKDAASAVDQRISIISPVVAGEGIRIEETAEGKKIHIADFLSEVSPKLNDLQAELGRQAANLDERMALWQVQQALSKKAYASLEQVTFGKISSLMTEIARIKARPAHIIETKVIEKPGVTVHEVIKELRHHWIIWLLFAASAASNVMLWVR